MHHPLNTFVDGVAESNRFWRGKLLCQIARLLFEPVLGRRHIPVRQHASLGVLLSGVSTNLLVEMSRGEGMSVKRWPYVRHGTHAECEWKRA
jgi:hypothetical protein